MRFRILESFICYFRFLVCISSSSVSLQSQIFLFWYLLGEYIVSVLFETLHSILFFARKDRKIVIFTCYYWFLVSIIYN